MEIIKSVPEITLKKWFSHSKKIVPELLILHHHFIIISTCTRQISGCSIDSLVNEIKMIELDLNISLLDRTNIFYSVLSLSKEICADNYFSKEIIDFIKGIIDFIKEIIDFIKEIEGFIKESCRFGDRLAPNQNSEKWQGKKKRSIPFKIPFKRLIFVSPARGGLFGKGPNLDFMREIIELIEVTMI